MSASEIGKTLRALGQSNPVVALLIILLVVLEGISYYRERNTTERVTRLYGELVTMCIKDRDP